MVRGASAGPPARLRFEASDAGIAKLVVSAERDDGVSGGALRDSTSQHQCVISASRINEYATLVAERTSG